MVDGEWNTNFMEAAREGANRGGRISGKEAISLDEHIKRIIAAHNPKNPELLEKMLKAIQPGMVVGFRCKAAGQPYEAIGRIESRFVADSEGMPYGFFLERGKNNDFVPYNQIISYIIYKPEN